MDQVERRHSRRRRRQRGIRKRVSGTPGMPRLTIFRSSKHIYAQVVDDLAGRTIVAASTVQDTINPGGNVAAAVEVGKKVAERAKAAGIEAVVFDRAGFRYHGRVRKLADAARESGLKL